MMSAEIIDSEILAGLRELVSSDNPGFLKEYFDLILASMPVRFKAIEKALSVSDFSALEGEAHSLKSSSANSGLTKMTEICAQLEKMGSAGTGLEGPRLLQELDVAIRDARREILALPEMK